MPQVIFKNDTEKENFEEAMAKKYSHIFLSEIYTTEGKPKDVLQIFELGTIDTGSQVLEVTSEVLQEIKRNFDLGARGQRIPIEIKHEDSGAYGWVTALWIEGEKMYIRPEWNSKGLQVLTDKEYAYLSPELLFNYKDSLTGQVFGIVLSGITLTNRPKMKHFTGVLEGFSECGKDEFIPPHEPEKTQDKEEEEIMELANTLTLACEKIKKHSELFRKKGSPQLRNSLSLLTELVKKHLNNNKEEKTMEDNKTAEVKPVENISLTELEKFKKEMEDSFKLKLSEVESKAQEEKALAEERVKLAEEKVNLLLDKTATQEDELFLSELIRDGKVLPKEKERELRRLMAARKAGCVKLSESDNYNFYEEAKAELSGREKVINYSEVGTSSQTPADLDREVLKLSEKYAKEGMSLKEATIKAKNELNYEYKKM